MGLQITQVSLTIFWLVLIIAGILKGYRTATLSTAGFQDIMKPVNQVLHLFAIAGIGILIGLMFVVVNYYKAVSIMKVGDGKEKSLNTEHVTVINSKFVHSGKPTVRI
jgi:hypothetical protein